MASTRIRKSRERSVAVALLTAVLAISVGLVSCGDEVTTGPEAEEEWEDAENNFPGLTISDPTGTPSAVAAPESGQAVQPSSTGLAYISAIPGTFDNVSSISITNLANGSSVTTNAVGGGFDPAALEAESGDTLRIEVRYPTGTTDTYFAKVPPRKRPKVVRTVPPKGATEVVLESTIRIVFTEPVNESSVNTDNIRLEVDGELVDGTFELQNDGLVAEFTPEETLQLGTVYTLVITTGVLDLQGDQLEEETEVTFATASRIVSLGAGWYHACAVDVVGSAFCWGANWYGQLGSAESNHEPPGRLPTELRFTSLSLGYLHTCGVTTGEEAYCWGFNLTGELGNGATTHSSSPSAVFGEYSFVSVSAGYGHSCGLAADSAGYCWGSNDSHQLGTIGPLETCTNEQGDSRPCRTAPRSVGSYVFLTVGGWVTCGIAADGASYCWGDNSNGQLGVEEAPETCSFEVGASWPCSSLPQRITGAPSFVSLTVGDTHACGLTAEGAAFCWGNNFNGQLGNGDSGGSGTVFEIGIDTNIPVQVINADGTPFNVYE